MINKVIEISPSILSADFKFLDEDIKDIINAGVKYLHFDVMDGQFVKNISFGIPVLKSLKEGYYPLIFDVHLMIIDPEKYLEDFIKAGADIVTIHYEAVKEEDIIRLSEFAHKLGTKFGLSIKPKTEVSKIKPFLKYLDLVLVMSVEPGFGGQSFIESSCEKISELKKVKEENKYQYLIEVDGGINDKTSKKAKKAGAEILVSGSYIFKSTNRKEKIESLR
jgi:ribulose-phosphate 3-epimerase